MLPAALIASLAATVLFGLMLAANLRLLPRLSREGARDAARRSGPWPSVSVVIPARDEQRDVAAAVGSHLAQDYPRLEVVVVEDRSTDRTPEILRELSAGEPRLSIVPGREPPPGWLGKPHALHLGAARAQGELLLFVDADVRWSPSALREAVALLEARRADFLMAAPRLEARGFWERVLMPNLACALYFGPAFLINADRARMLAAGGGAGNLIRRRVYDALGGHEALRDSVIDDVRLALTAKRAGFRALAVRGEDRVAVRMYRGFRQVVDGFTKNTAWVFSGAMGPILLAAICVPAVAALLPAAVLIAAAAGAPVPPSAVALAAAAAGLAVLLRLALAAVLREPLWPAFTHALMHSVWTGIIARSLFRRFVLRRVVWRGRRYDAADARF